MARFYANENFPFPVVVELRRLDHDVVTIQETGKANQEYPDEAVLAFARDDSRIVLTINRKDFIRLHHLSSDHCGIIVCTTDLDFVGQARRIHELTLTNGDLRGQLIRVNRPQS
jgi:predicted nuclease of predicted toxin-antitoxin system